MNICDIYKDIIIDKNDRMNDKVKGWYIDLVLYLFSKIRIIIMEKPV